MKPERKIELALEKIKERIRIQELESKLFHETMRRQYQHLKDAPIDEYFSRIMDIAKQFKDHGIKI
jgi:hypothetical protein